jgi:hypothetical protein
LIMDVLIQHCHNYFGLPVLIQNCQIPIHHIGSPCPRLSISSPSDWFEWYNIKNTTNICADPPRTW